jgi:hypothetical protein
MTQRLFYLQHNADIHFNWRKLADENLLSEKLTTLLCLLKLYPTCDKSYRASLANSSDRSRLHSAEKGILSPPNGVSETKKLSIQKECTRLPLSDSLQLWVYSSD